MDGVEMASGQHEREQELYREISRTVTSALPGVEVLALEVTGRERFCVYIDQPGGVDHALCERVTGILRPYLDRYSVEVSSPGIERPLRTRAHFEHAIGRNIRLKTAELRLRGRVAAAKERTFQVSNGTGEPVDIPYEAIVRANLIDEG
jgi:ribosome maturation factor RimP